MDDIDVKLITYQTNFDFQGLFTQITNMVK